MSSNENDDAGDQWLVDQIRDGDQQAWQSLINRYEGRLTAYVRSRLSHRSEAEDIVQDTFIGFLTSLPNYDGSRKLEAYLFSICGYKLTDFLRRSGRRPTLQPRGGSASDGGGMVEPIGWRSGASTIHRSIERKQLESDAVAGAIAQQVQRWRDEGNWTKLRVIELMFVQGLGNKDVASLTGLSEQQIANFKSDFVIRLRSVISRMNLDAGVFPELVS